MGTKINLDYQVDNTQFDGKVKDQIKEPGGGTSRLEVVNVGGDTMTGTLKVPNVNFNIAGAGGLGVNTVDTATVYGSYAGSNSILHIKFGNNAADKLQIEYYNGSTVSNLIVLDGNKDMTAAVRDLTVNSSRDIALTADTDMQLTSPACTITATACTITTSTINLLQGNNKINVSSNKWRFTNDGSNYYYMQEGLPIGAVLMYKGASWVNNSTLPGWYKCDGDNGTPDLRDKFIRCESTSGNTGGSDDGVATHNHTSEVQSANHKHTHDHGSFTSAGSSAANTGDKNPSHTHYLIGHMNSGRGSSRWETWYQGSQSTQRTTSSANINHSHSMAHTHSINVPSKTSGNQSASHTHTINNNGTSGGNKPAYYSLIFIIKIS